MDLVAIGNALYGGSTPASESAPAAAPSAVVLTPTPQAPPRPADEAPQIREWHAERAREAAAAAATPKTERQVMADVLYGPKVLPAVEGVPDAVKQLRDLDAAEPGNRLYAPTVHAEIASAMRALHSDPLMAEAQTLEWSRVVRDVGAHADDVAVVVGAIHKFHGSPLSDADEQASAEKARAALSVEHGTNTPRALAAMRALLARDPRLADQLILSGAIFDPDVFVRTSRLALAQAARGRLKLT